MEPPDSTHSSTPLIDTHVTQHADEVQVPGPMQSEGEALNISGVIQYVRTKREEKMDLFDPADRKRILELEKEIDNLNSICLEYYKAKEQMSVDRSNQMPADWVTLQRARFIAENNLVELVKQKSAARAAKGVLPDLIDACTHNIARRVFDSEYRSVLEDALKAVLGGGLPYQRDIDRSAALYEGDVIGRLEKESLSVFKSQRDVAE